MSTFFRLLQGTDRELVLNTLQQLVAVTELRSSVPALRVVAQELGEEECLTGAVGLIFLLAGLAHAEHLMAATWEQLLPNPEVRHRMRMHAQRLVADTMLCATEPPSLEVFVDMLMLKALAEGIS
jgi:hypothetical protein